MKFKGLKGLDLKGKKVAVGMSGGVDSSVAALMLKKVGADVFGISMHIVPWSRCCLPDDLLEAKAVAKKLGIPHYTIDLRKKFEKEAIDYFISESKAGRTPNPCVPCNRKVKFGDLIKEAEKKGAEYFATGHYARLELKKGKTILKRPVDTKKDQSYVLSMLPKKVFKKLIFPIGHYTKKEIRAIAKRNNIQVHSKPENQDLCFLNKPKGDFVKWWTKEKLVPGNIIDELGNIIGKHRGIVHYTIGQRKGLGIKNHQRLYVTKILPKTNTVVVGERDKLDTHEFYVKNLNWVSMDKLEKPMFVDVLIRNKSKPHRVKIIPDGKMVKIVAKKPVWGISPGQIAVFIKGEIVLGGGWII